MLHFDAEKITENCNFDGMLAAIRQAMVVFESKNYLMPDRMHLDQMGNTLLLMPCMTPEYFGTKLVSVFPQNRVLGEPIIYGIMVLNDGKTGKPIATFDGAKLTALRTGAVGGVSVDLLTPETISTIGLVGCGVQGLHQALFACAVRPIKTISIFNRSPQKYESFKTAFHKYYPSIEVIECQSVIELLEKSELVITATTSNTPVLPDIPELLLGKNFLGVGSFRPDMREFPDSLFPLLGDIYVDIPLAKKESGDLAIPLKNNWIKEKQLKTIGNWIKNGSKPKIQASGTTLFKSVGMAIFDLFAAAYIYETTT